MEIKNPTGSYGRRGLNARQQRFVRTWNGSRVHVVHSAAEALGILGVETSAQA